MDLVVLTDQPGLWVASDSRVLKPAEMAAVRQVGELVSHAQAREKSMLRQSMQAYEAERARGYAQGLAQAQEELAGHLAAVAAARYTALADLEPTLVDIVMQAVSLLTRGADRTWFIAHAVEAVAGLLRKARWSTLRVHPSQVEAAHHALGSLQPQEGFHRLISVEADSALGLQDCVFETDAGIADASLDVQLAAIRCAVAAAVTDFVAQPAP